MSADDQLARAPRLVLLTNSAAALPSEAPWPQGLFIPRVTLWCGPGATADRRRSWLAGSEVRELVVRRGQSGLRGRPRATAARVRSGGLAGQEGISPSYLWALKSDRDFARAARRGDVIVSMDPETDRAMRVAPELARDVPVLDSGHAGPEGAVWVELRRWHGAVESLSTAGEWTEQMPGLLQCLEGTGPVRPPVPLLAPFARRIELAGIRAAERLPRREAAALLAVLRALLQRAGEPDLLEAATSYVDLWEGRDRRDDVQLADVVRSAAVRADDALTTADRPVALHRLGTAFAVALHRARHCEALYSPLIERPGEVLGPIWTSTTYAGLRDRTTERPALTRRTERAPALIGPRIPQVTVLPGAYGAFHHDLVAVLSGPARVRVAKLLSHPSMQRRQLIGADLQLLDALRRGEVDVLRERWDGAPADVDLTEQLAALKSLALHVRRSDVVVGEWFDAGTMWASHLVPPGTRMVVRSHGLDILDPWVHLVDWRGIDAVLATTPPLGGLLHDLTHAAGGPEPVQVLPYRPDLADPAPHREPDLRFTLGMVGWGRQVKDAHFALDLVERDERRRLVLIGAGFPEVSPGAIQPYADSLRARLSDPRLARRVEVVGRTRDVPMHLARVGIILSASRREGWHLGLIEGAASGAVPVVRNWPLLASRDGARSTHPPEWVVDDLDEADHRIAELADPALWAQASAQARARTLQRYDPEPIAAAYRRLILAPGT